MDKLTKDVVNRLLDWGADLVGIAPVERFANAPDGHKPTDFLPECKSVISIALHLFQGMADVWGEYNEPGKTITSYLHYGYGLPNLENALLANRMAKLLEYSGYKTLCFLPTWMTSYYKYLDEIVETNKVKAEFSHRHAAAATGIVDLGWNGLGISPEFGTMQRFNSILTSAELEPTPLWDGPALCRPDACGMKCVRLCPAGAFSETEGQSLSIDGKTITYSTHDNIRCVYGLHGMVAGSGGRTNMELPDGPGQAMTFFADYHGDRVHMLDRFVLNDNFGIVCGDYCGKCLIYCPSKKLAEKDMRDYDLSRRHSSLNRHKLG